MFALLALPDGNIAAGTGRDVVTGAGTVDLFFTDGRRIRALLGNKCTAIDFYSGFYIRPPVDGRVCARRDPGRSRSGAVCEIRAFKRLVPKR